jgi:adenylate cyclase
VGISRACGWIVRGKTEEDIAILFADVVDSSRLYTTYGDAEARRMVGSCLQALTQVVGEQQGQVIKTIGDEIMCTFPTADQAVMAAVVMHQRVQEQAKAGALHNTLSVRIGLHRGGGARGRRCVRRRGEPGRPHGLPVQGPSDHDHAPDGGGAGRRPAPAGPLRGPEHRQGPAAAPSICTKSCGTPARPPWPPPASGPAHSGPDGAHAGGDPGGASWTVDMEHPVLTMGRSSAVRRGSWTTRASRLHAKIEFGKERFILRDVSTNGTYVQLEDGGARQVRRDELDLTSNGVVMLGRRWSPLRPCACALTLRQDVARL